MRKRRKGGTAMADEKPLENLDDELQAEPMAEGDAAVQAGKAGDTDSAWAKGSSPDVKNGIPAGTAGTGEGILLMQEDIEKINKALAEREEYLGMAQRVTADFDNYRKRTAATRAEAHGDGIREAVIAILPTIDNLDRAIDSMKSADESMLKGVEMVRRGLLDALCKLGLAEIEALGQPFDPEFHEAVMRSPAEDGQSDGQIVEVFKKGYQIGDKVARYSMVRVAHDS